MRRSATLPLLSLFMLAAIPMAAQPGPFGCHFHRNQSAPMAPLSPGQRSEIEATIARSDTVDILHYDIHLDVTDYFGQSITAATTVSYKALVPDVGRIVLDLLDLTVDSVVSPDGPLSFVHDGQFLEVLFAVTPVVDEERELTVYYQGIPYRDPQWGGFYFAQNYIYNLGIGISTIPPNFGKVWYPCFDSFVERATYTYHVKSAGTYRLHGQGTFLGEVVLGGDTVIRSYSLQQAIPTHVSAIAVADYAVHETTHQGLNGEIPITLTAKPANLSAMITRFEDLGAAIDACEFWYGPYPYERVGYVLTTDGALEIPTNVAYPQFMTTQSLFNNRGLLTHELGHHWWGDIVTPYIHNDMWLKEGPAEYSTHLIEEWLGGQAGLVKAVKDNQSFILRQAHINDEGFQALSPMPDPHIYGTHTYYKGASVMHNLRGYLGDTLFRQAMVGIQTGYANTTLSAEGFKDALQATTGENLEPFFDAWVFAPGYSVFEVRHFDAVEAGGGWEVELSVGQKLRGASVHHEQVPIDLTFIAADGSTHDQLIEVGGALTLLTASSPFEPAMVVLNRHTRLNQARLDHELIAVPGQNLPPTIPYVDLRLYGNTIVDSTLIRVDHIWAGPDQFPLGTQISALSGTHYWNLDGLWPVGTVLGARIFYNGSNDTQLDHELIDGNESGICIVHRASPQDPWEVYLEQEVVAGSLTNGTGYINLENLRKGQYAFAKTSGIIAVEDTDLDVLPGIGIFPVPAARSITVTGQVEGAEHLIFDVIGLEGRIVQRMSEQVNGPFSVFMDVSAVPDGAYVMRVMTTTGVLLGTKRFEVMH